MTLIPGTKLGPYEIVAPLGAGGMGEVYRAKDPRLGREVAIKVLPHHLSENPELRARFEREARTVSSLNHPHICTLHDVGREGDTDYLVMELVEGDTLAQRLARGPLPASDALRYGIEIADALDRAHRAGIVHRDLKPGNIMLAKSGAKLMDFGLARASEVAGAPGSTTQSPTLTRPLTAEGAIVGTFQYMAPEQLDGGESDARGDIWALGATLYEMITGKKAFTGRSQASLIASILKEEPQPVSQAQPLAPPALDQVIRACLAKDPEERIQTAHDVKLQLQWIAEGGSQAGVAAPVAARRRSREAMAWALATVALLGVVALGALLIASRPEPPRVMRFEVSAPPNVTTMTWPRLSPDGRMLAFLATDSTGVQRIWVRPLDALQARALPGTEAPGRPFWSPDSRFLGYVSNGKFRKVPVAGGPPVALADAPGRFDGSWGSRDFVVFDGTQADSLWGVSAAGGTMRPLTHRDRAAGETNHSWPSMLPDGKHFLFVASYSGTGGDRIMIGSLDSNERKSIGTTDGRVEYAPPGYLVFSREGMLMAQPFDVRALKTTGEAVPVGENLAMASSGLFSVSASGALAYRSVSERSLSRLVWFDRNGRTLGDVGSPAEYRDIALSPDGTQIAMSMVDAASGKEDLWVRQVARGVTSRLTFDPGDEFLPVWSPDGRRVGFTSDRSGQFRTFIANASGVGALDSIASFANGPSGPTSWSRDGASLMLNCMGGATQWDVWRAPVTGGAAPAPFVATSYADNNGAFSPDGRWIAYQSNQSGRTEIYVQAADGSGGKWQISSAGGVRPLWRADGKEMYFEAPDHTLTAVPVTAGSTFEAGTPIPLFRASITSLGYLGPRWDVSADGQKFLVNTPTRGPDRATFVVVTNWASELKRK